MLGDFRNKPQSKTQWLLWWRINQDEVQEQVDKYETLGWFESARKLSVLCLLFSVVLTIALVALKITPAGACFDAALFLILAAFIYCEHRWAMVAAMGLWTVEKAVTAILGIGTASVTGVSYIPGVSFFVSILWWAAYMHAFYLALRVEQERRKQTAGAPEAI